ncbi:hypothetical protein ACIP79_30715 [Streptomyces sp. NPDC088747]|uniref:hypothetical protein n=1 Tax=Streptomyces sp. NPDC088747 TaxID=3365886 RepID=UPI0038277D4A
MGASRRTGRRIAQRRTVAAVGLAVFAVGGVVACEPGGLSSATVAYTTDQTVTKELERRNADVAWLSCTAAYDGDNEIQTPGSSVSPAEDTVADIDCTGETSDGQDITVTGKVTRAVSGRCVRGDLTAEIDGKQWFHVTGLGNCDAPATPGYTPPVNDPDPAVTVTVTRTVWCQGNPTCWPEGK